MAPEEKTIDEPVAQSEAQTSEPAVEAEKAEAAPEQEESKE